MSRKSAHDSLRWMVLVAIVLSLSPSEVLGARAFTGGTLIGNEYEDAVRGAGRAEGDIWGGEQGSDPEVNPVGPVVGESTPLINTLPFGGKPEPGPVPNAGHALWIYQLGAFLDWLGIALSFPNL